MLTDADARHAVITAIEANGTDVAAADEYDIDAIVEAVHEAAGDYDVEAVDHDEFWAIVERHELPDIPQIAISDIRDLLRDGRDNAVLHINHDSRGYTLAVWVEEYAPNIVISYRTCLDGVGTDDAASIDGDEIREYILPDLQDDIDKQVREDAAYRARMAS